jgi:outer membrane receptor protein involved in Fe transport
MLTPKPHQHKTSPLTPSARSILFSSKAQGQQVRNAFLRIHSLGGRMFRRIQLISLLMILVVSSILFSVVAIAQTTTARMSGVVTDESGAVLPGATLTISNTDTGIVRTATSDSSGRYIVLQLPPGPYRVSTTLAGFDTLVREGIQLEVGQEAALNLSLRVGSVNEQVTVVGDAPLVNVTGSAVSGVVDEKRIVDLPLNGRDFTQLALVQPGVLSARNTDSTASKGYGTRISIAGSRPDQTAWLLDGTNIKGASNFGTPGSAAGVILGVDAVREFQVLTSNFSAEFGGTTGGVVNMITKSGTNQYHGSAYWFHRNDNFDARSFFDRKKLEFKRNQYGFTAGGPILQDKAFFFGNYESLRSRLGLTNIAIVPDATVRLGAVSPSVQPYLALWPTPNGSLLAGGLGEYIAPATEPIDEHYFMTRLDYKLSDSSFLFGRFTYDGTLDIKPDEIPITSTEISTQPRYATIQYEKIFTPTFLGNSRVAFNRSYLTAFIAVNIDYPTSLYFFNPNVPPSLSFPGATSFGPDSRNERADVQNLYQFSQSFTWTKGNHLLKFGGNLEQVNANPDGGPRNSGAFTWANLNAFLTDGPLQAFTMQVPGSTSQRTFRQQVYGLYLQDDWKVQQNLTLNLGLRYEPFSTPEEKWGRISVVQDWRTATKFDTEVPWWRNPSKKNFSPRVGFAWDPRGNGRTALRGGFGLFYATLLSSYYKTPSYRNPPFAAVISTPVGNLASARADTLRISPTILTSTMNYLSYMEIFQYDLDPTYEMKFNLTLEHELPGNMAVALGYIGGRGIHLWGFQSANALPSEFRDGREFVATTPNPSATFNPRPNPNTGVGSIRNSDAQSFYNAMQVEVKKRFSHGLQFQSSYTWSKNIDDSATGIALTDLREGEGSRPYNTKADRGLSALHLSQNLVLNGIYAFPEPNIAPVSDKLLGGWQVSAIYSASSGIPFTAYTSGRNAPNLSYQAGRQHPDIVAGRSMKDATTGDPNAYIDLSAFALPEAGYYGNAGRNILLGPDFSNVDFSLQKNTKIGLGEGGRLEFRADFFNMLNHANFAVPSSLQLFNPTTRTPQNPSPVVAGAGKITGTVNPGRQMQFGLKLIF